MSQMFGSDLILAVDLGGTKTAAALFTGEGEILDRREEATCQAGPEAGIAQIVGMLKALLAHPQAGRDRVKGIGVGIPAVLEPETDFVTWGPNLAGWRNVDLRGELRRQLDLPAFVEYDGHTAVLGEWWKGAGQGYQSIAMVIIGTGIGGGLILDGKLYRGRDRLAGAAGWFALTDNPELEDQPGQALGHWESLAAGPGIARRAAAFLKENPDSSLNHLPAGETLTARRIFDEARQGDPLANRVVEEAAGLIGLGVANIVSLVNPEIVILGGGVGRQGDLLLGRVQEAVLRWAQPASARSVKFVSAKLGSEAGLYGAAYAVIDRTKEA